jgi:hypothetical protein
MFYHIHMVNGHVINHSHPYKHTPFNKNPYQSHSHSSAAYNLIQQLNEPNWDDALASVQIPDPIVVFFAYNVIYNSHEITSNRYSHPQLRAPPAI